MNKNFYLYLLKLYSIGLLLLSILRLCFFLYFYDEMGQHTATDKTLAFLIGVMMDSNAVSMALLFSFLVSIPVKFMTPGYTRFFYYIYHTAVLVILFTNLADIFYFKQYGTRMNALATELFNNYEIVVPMLYKGFPIIRILLAFAAFTWLYMWWNKRQFYKSHIIETPRPVFWSIVTIATFLSTSLMLYGMPLWYITSFSSSSLLNQMSSNGAYTFVKSIDQKRIYEEDLSVFPEIKDEDAIQKVQEFALHSSESHEENWWPTMRKSIAPVNITKPKNIVFIVIETFSAINIGILNGNRLSPQFDRWSKKGVLLTHCYANGSRTQQGVTSIISGFPAVLGNSLIRRKGLNEFHSLGNILLEQGYHTQFIHNGKASYDDMDMFMTQGGFQQIVDVESFSSWKFKNEWGVCDEDLFDKAYDMIWSNKDDQPKLSVLLTMSNHAPYDIPTHFAQAHPEVQNMEPSSGTFYYTDYALGQFLDRCAKHPEFKNTIFVIVADHGEVYEQKHHNYKMFHIPALILNSSRVSGTMDAVCSQIDLAPTVLREAGYQGTYHFIGQNLFSPHFKPIAISRNTSDIVFAQTQDGIVWKFDAAGKRESIHKVDSNAYIGEPIMGSLEIAEEFKTYMQGLSVIYRNGMYQYKIRCN